MTGTDQPELTTLPALAAALDPFMRSILACDEVVQMAELASEVSWRFRDTSVDGAGYLYVVWMEIDDILDGYPASYGAEENERLALREWRLAARDWLDMPRTSAGLAEHVNRWRTRVAQHDWPEPGGVDWREWTKALRRKNGPETESEARDQR